jgi:hypothetical protein
MKKPGISAKPSLFIHFLSANLLFTGTPQAYKSAFAWHLQAPEEYF